MDYHQQIIDAETLRKLSGKSSPAAVQKWANSQGIPTLMGADGPFTTREGLNYAMGVGAANEPAYQPDQVA